MPKKLFLFLVFLFSSSTIVVAATLVVANDGQLTGATNVNVNGAFYDVSFMDGTCIELFNGCDSESDFIFSTNAEAQAAADALLDQVFTDSDAGLFDSSPNLTRGCEDILKCRIITLHTLLDGDTPYGSATQNTYNIAGDTVDFIWLNPDTDTGNHSLQESLVYAVWSAPVSVPVPAAGWLFTSALLVLVGKKRLSHFRR